MVKTVERLFALRALTDEELLAEVQKHYPKIKEIDPRQGIISLILSREEGKESTVPIQDCIHGTLYRIHSRNLTIGVWDEEAVGFIGLRTKFGRTFASTEYHWDTGAPHGTAMPIEELPEYLPDNIEVRESNNADLERWLKEMETKYPFPICCWTERGC